MGRALKIDREVLARRYGDEIAAVLVEADKFTSGRTYGTEAQPEDALAAAVGDLRRAPEPEEEEPDPFATGLLEGVRQACARLRAAGFAEDGEGGGVILRGVEWALARYESLAKAPAPEVRGTSRAASVILAALAELRNAGAPAVHDDNEGQALKCAIVWARDTIAGHEKELAETKALHRGEVAAAELAAYDARLGEAVAKRALSRVVARLAAVTSYALTGLVLPGVQDPAEGFDAAFDRRTGSEIARGSNQWNAAKRAAVRLAAWIVEGEVAP